MGQEKQRKKKKPWNNQTRTSCITCRAFGWRRRLFRIEWGCKEEVNECKLISWGKLKVQVLTIYFTIYLFH